jgi:hypothetical protein
MLLKFLVVIWFFRVLINLFTNHYIARTIFTTMGENTKGIKDVDKASEEEKYAVGVSIIIFLLYALWLIIIFIIDFFMMLAMLKYDNTIFTLIFIGLTLVNFIYSLIKGKLASNKKSEKSVSETYFENADNLKKFTLVRFICKITNIVYWGYAIYLLFL